MWRDRLQAASWKGVPFHVEQHELEVGRRLSVHEYPLRDTPYTEDLGRSARRYAVTGYLVGDNYMSVRDRLIEAAESGSVGELIHPYIGRLNVYCKKCRARETTSDGGYVSLSLEFVEAGDRIMPTTGAVPTDRVAAARDGLVAAVKKVFEENLQIRNVQGWVREAHSSNFRQLGEVLEAAQLTTKYGVETVASVVDSVASWSADIRDLIALPQTIAQSVSGTADTAIRGIFGVRTHTTPHNARRSLEAMANYSAEETQGHGVVARTINANAAVTTAFVRTLVIAELAQVSIDAEYGSYDEAVAARSVVLDLIEEAIQSAADDPVYAGLLDLRVAVAEGLPDPGARLPHIDAVTLPESRPSLVVAYRLYGNLDRDQDIITRNALRHPGFVPPGTDVYVLRPATTGA